MLAEYENHHKDLESCRPCSAVLLENRGALDKTHKKLRQLVQLAATA